MYYSLHSSLCLHSDLVCLFFQLPADLIYIQQVYHLWTKNIHGVTSASDILHIHSIVEIFPYLFIPQTLINTVH